MDTKFNKGFLITNSLQAFVKRLGRGHRTIIGFNIFWCPASWKPIAQTKQNIISSDNPLDHKCSPTLDNLAPDKVYYNHPHPFAEAALCLSYLNC